MSTTDPTARAAAPAAALALVASLIASTAQAAADPHSLSGVWWTTSYQPHLTPADGSALPFTPEGKARYDANMAGLKSGKLVDEAIHLCLPEGMPRAMTSAYPFQIIQTPEQLTFVHEANRAYRIVRMGDKHADPDVWDPSYMGEGIAHWDGDALVIDSTNFKADKIFLDATGLPASDKLHLVERVRLIDGGRRLEDDVTVDDPVIFAKSWTARRVFARRDDVELRTDWVCGEPHRDVSALTGAKAR